MSERDGMALAEKLKSAWNAFTKAAPHVVPEPSPTGTAYFGSISPSRTPAWSSPVERTIVSSIYTTLSADAAGIPIKHVKLDDKGRYLEDIDSPLNLCLTLEPNLDQGPRAFRQDVFLTLLQKGCLAIVPVDTSKRPDQTTKFDVHTMRVGEIVSWHPQHVRVSAYNERNGQREEILLEKRFVSIVENPFYEVMNNPNSTLQRLIRKLTLLDAVDEQSSSGKLDVIIQLPYAVKSEMRKAQAQNRREELEVQLRGSQYGIAYMDATEKITQLNRPSENNLLTQVEYLTKMLFGQLGLTEEVLNGTASEEVMTNYYNRTIEPLLDAVVEAMQRSFLGRAAFAGSERVAYYRNLFKFVPMKDIAEIADKFARNEVTTANEVRQFIGLPPHEDPKADELANPNMPIDKQTQTGSPVTPVAPVQAA